MARYRILQIDAFTDRVFGGNPAGVVPRAEGLTDEQMQLIAREMNVSETAFVTGGGGDCLDVRFFTPTEEVDLCGHATIATFWLLALEGRVERKGERATVRQRTRAGTLEVDIQYCDDHPAGVMMTQVPPRTAEGGGWSRQLQRALHLASTDWLSRMPPPQVISTGLPDLIIPLPDRETLWSLSPDLKALAEYCRSRDIISVHCFTTDTLSEDSVAHCRDFSPAVGVPEEAATGTASGATGAYLILNRLVDTERDGTVTMILEQGHILDRPSTIHVEVEVKEGHPVGVRVGGEARVVLDGFLLVG
ncbi:MAG: PhzF family phenazine biosynthesis protein [Bacillota bacterium]